ncbi:MAG: Mfa1 fimbrilin C-terminal domain-containing protein [Muribaculaceae bacterium]|nr:Mfa1 fimbrilin C-terminal domain-containing protein [Muribaculaceae bacterium]
MSSSMVFPREDMANTNGNTITSTPGKDNFGPASMVRSFTWFKTKDEAKQAPVFSFFVERLQSKFTMNFKFGSENIYYYFTQDLNDPGSDDHQPIQHCVLEANSTAGNPVIHTSNNSKLLNVDFIPTEEYKTLRYVKDYRRRAPGSEYDDNFIKTSETWKINLTGWGVNATEKEEYIFKNLDITDSYYGEDKWNVPALSPYRNFWAESAHYKDVRFPDQYRPGKKLETTYDANGKISKIEIKDDNSFSPLEGKGNLYNLYYYSYLNLQNRTTHQYAPEHTVDPSSVFTSIPEQDASDIDKTHAIKDLAYMRASTHLILCAQLLIEGMEEEGIYDADSFNDKGQVVKGENSVHSKFYMNGIYWSEDAYLEYVAEYLGYWLQNDFFHNSDGNLYVNVDDLNNKNERVTKLADGGDFYFEKLNMKGSDNWVHIIPNPDVIKEDEPNCNICYYDTKEEKFFKIDRDVFEILALSHPEYFAQRFWNGRMYYSIPVIHYQKDDASLYLGKYGVVRNHWYNYTITKFSGIGTPVDANTQAIVPNNERSYETLGVTLSVLPWHSINEEVDISNQRPNETPDEIDLDLYAKINDWFYTGKYEEF